MNSNIIICNSGGALGSDTIFSDQCTRNEIKVIAWSFHGHNTDSPFRKILSKIELDEGFEHIKIANKTLKRNIYGLNPYVKNLLSRNWFQVVNSEAIFAISTIQDDMKIVSSGTGWAIQMSIDNKKPVYVFDQDKNMWFQFNYENNVFEIYKGIPKLTETFAGVGTRSINQNGIEAIKKLFEENGRKNKKY